MEPTREEYWRELGELTKMKLDKMRRPVVKPRVLVMGLRFVKREWSKEPEWRKRWRKEESRNDNR